ncbi:NAD(+)/NADH kinase [Candidatus Micrarchaeota archaeon]|nr:NAD(+)/NADH kinase [Candidatus Micrarchaeota archaeon]MBU1165456.1 NAD(+)/NADH kinase [Candidatus Micrarchaeota archaeon]MBU1887437.1 NAD(+)/NADH kinase [Candidatus Micrarchaeota archaeon]
MRIKIIHNPQKHWTEELAGQVSAFLCDKDHEIVTKDANYTICIGGDGTILYANHRNELSGRIIGIGSKSSYICQLTRDSWEESLPDFILKKSSVIIMGLNASLRGNTHTAINDFVIHTHDYRVLEIEVTINRKTSSFRGDGLIISTPLGSASYAYSAGGEALKPEERKISIVPICPYKRTFTPTLLPENEHIEVKVGRECAFIVDGIFVRHLKSEEVITMEKGEDLLFVEGVGKYKR